MKNIIHRLTESNSEKVLILTLNDNKLISESGKTGKLKTTENDYSTPEEALKNFYKKEWDALKKGYFLNNENAKIGEPSLHTYIGGGYTGCLSFQQTPKGIYVYKNEGGKDYLILIDNIGNVLETIELPIQLVWNIEYRNETNSLILDISHFIFEYKIDNKSFNNLDNKERNWTSFVSVSKTVTAFAAFGKIYIVDYQNKVLHTLNYDIETINGTTPFQGKLSADGKLLAFHNKRGEIQIIDTNDGKLLSKVVADFEIAEQLELAGDNNLLIVKEQYGTWGMRYFELSGKKEIKISSLDITKYSLEVPEYSTEVKSFCFSADQSKLVIVQRENALVFDFNEKKFLHSFHIEHTVKNCKIKFVGDKLGVRTDYGCFSIYNV